MKTCRKDCIHGDVCGCRSYEEEICDSFKDKSLFIELPCKVGSTIYRIDEIGVQCSHENSYYDEYWCGGCPHLELGDCDAHKKPYIFVIKNATAQEIFGNEHLIGTRAFLTREEAEKALAERSGR